MRRPATLSACLVLAVLGAAGCGGGEAGGPTETTNEANLPTSTRAGPTTAPQPGNVVAVDIPGISYNPGAVSVKVGQTVRWKNSDAVAHTATADRGATFDSGTLSPGGTYTWTPTKAGTVGYYCTIHGQQQRGTINVTR